MLSLRCLSSFPGACTWPQYLIGYLRGRQQEPTHLARAQEILFAGEPADVTEIVRANQQVLQKSPIPNLLFYAEPGAVIGTAEVTWCQEHCANLTSINLGAGSHFLPEDHSAAIAASLRAWLSRLNLVSAA